MTTCGSYSSFTVIANVALFVTPYISLIYLFSQSVNQSVSQTYNIKSFVPLFIFCFRPNDIMVLLIACAVAIVVSVFNYDVL